MGDLGVGALPTAHPTSSTSTGTTGSTARSPRSGTRSQSKQPRAVQSTSRSTDVATPG